MTINTEKKADSQTPHVVINDIPVLLQTNDEDSIQTGVLVMQDSDSDTEKAYTVTIQNDKVSLTKKSLGNVDVRGLGTENHQLRNAMLDKVFEGVQELAKKGAEKNSEQVGLGKLETQIILRVQQKILQAKSANAMKTLLQEGVESALENALDKIVKTQSDNPDDQDGSNLADDAKTMLNLLKERMNQDSEIQEE